MIKDFNVTVGDVFGDLTLTSLPLLVEVGTTGKNQTEAIFKCICAKEVLLPVYRVINGNTLSCGCNHRSKVTKHGLSYHPVYKAWAGANQRCHNPKSQRYHRYGGRGIYMYRLWRKYPVKFVEYCMSLGWDRSLTLDRINNDKGYAPGNIQFVSRRKNLQNRKCTLARRISAQANVKLAWKASIKPVQCIETGKKYSTLKKAAKDIGAHQQNITSSINRSGTCKGFTFKFI